MCIRDRRITFGRDGFRRVLHFRMGFQHGVFTPAATVFTLPDDANRLDLRDDPVCTLNDSSELGFDLGFHPTGSHAFSHLCNQTSALGGV